MVNTYHNGEIAITYHRSFKWSALIRDIGSLFLFVDTTVHNELYPTIVYVYLQIKPNKYVIFLRQ